MTLQTRLTVTYLACGLVPLAIAGFVSYWLASSGVAKVAGKADLENRVTESLIAQRQLKQEQIEHYFSGVRDQILTFSSNPATIQAMAQLQESFARICEDRELQEDEIDRMRRELMSYYTGDFTTEYRRQNGDKQPNVSAMTARLDDQSIALQHAYVIANPHPLGSKHQLDRAESASPYDAKHAYFHPSTRGFLEKFGYYDIFLVDIDTGDIVYSVFKELDYTTSLIDGPYAQTNFGEAFRRAAQSTEKGGFAFVDFKQYTPSYEAPASFIASPIFDGEKKIGVAIFQLPIDRITDVATSRAGLGDTGETFVVGDDFLMRSDSFHDVENRSVIASFRRPESGQVKTPAIAAAVESKEAGTAIEPDYRGVETLIAYSPVDVLGKTWCLAAKMDTAEAFRELNDVRAESKSATRGVVYWNLVLGLVAGLIVGLVAWFVSRRISPAVINTAENQSQIQAIGRSNAVISFDMNGTILDANENFLTAVGYSLHEIQGKHHRMFVEPEFAKSAEYKEFWECLKRGEFPSGEFKRIANGGREIWIQASYNPILDEHGEPFKVVKYATDVTAAVEQREAAVRLRSVVDASDAAFMMIDRDFVVTYANDATMELLNEHKDTFRALWPAFEPQKILGQCIDQFHKKPDHQRSLLADPSSLPLKTDIQVGPLTFALAVSALFDSSGQYAGNALEWLEVTEDRKRLARDQKIAAFQASEVEQFSQVMSQIAMGDLTQSYDVANFDDDTAEVGRTFTRIANSVNAMCANLREVLAGLASNAGHLASSSTELSATASQLSGGAEATTCQSATVAAASEEMSLNMKNMSASTEQVSTNIKTVATAVEELTVSIGEIAKTAEQASSIAERASQLTKSSNETVSELGTAAEEIGKVIEVIQDIAEQTNLLALNATIEAARAGEAGKGFAVVATEVKELARQTAGATEDIRNRIQRIQGSTGEAVRSIGEVGSVIQQVNDASSTIASAVEEQSIITKGIAGRINETATAVVTVSTGVGESATACDEVARNIAGVDSSAKQTAQGAAQLRTVGTELSQLAEQLQAIVGQFQFTQANKDSIVTGGAVPDIQPNIPQALVSAV